MKNNSVHTTVLTALMAVLSLILSQVKMAVPGLPPFLTLDLGFIPLFLALLIMGYKHTLVVALLKNLLHFALISHEPTGSLALLIVEFVFITCIVKVYKASTKKFLIGGLIGTLAITLVMSLMNYFVLLPMYGYIVNLADIVNNVKTIVAYGIIPFNLIKGAFLILLFFISKKVYQTLPNSLLVKFKKQNP